MCKSRTGVRLGKLPMFWRTLIAGAAISVDDYLPQTPRQGKHKSLQS
jgi:hypothetical protein